MLLQTVEHALSNISIWSIILPVAIGFFYYQRLDKGSRVILYVIVAACVPQILDAFIARTAFLNITYNIYTFIDYTLTLVFFIKIAPEQKKLYYFCSAIYLLIAGYFVFNFGIKSFLPLLVSLNSFFYIIWILTVIKGRYNLDDDLYLFDSRNSLFWFISGLLFYSACTFVVFLLWDFLKSHPHSVYKNLWIIHYIFNISMYIAFAIGMYKNRYQ